jgi:hypothetical protein
MKNGIAYLDFLSQNPKIKNEIIDLKNFLKSCLEHYPQNIITIPTIDEVKKFKNITFIIGNDMIKTLQNTDQINHLGIKSFTATRNIKTFEKSVSLKKDPESLVILKAIFVVEAYKTFLDHLRISYQTGLEEISISYNMLEPQKCLTNLNDLINKKNAELEWAKNTLKSIENLMKILGNSKVLDLKAGFREEEALTCADEDTSREELVSTQPNDDWELAGTELTISQLG